MEDFDGGSAGKFSLAVASGDLCHEKPRHRDISANLHIPDNASSVPLDGRWFRKSSHFGIKSKLKRYFNLDHVHKKRVFQEDQ